MSAAPDHARRRRRAWQLLADHGADALLVSDRTNVFYLTGFSGSNGSLLLTEDAALLITDGRYPEQAARECPDLTVGVERDPDAAAVRRGLADGAQRVAVEAASIAWARYLDLAAEAGADVLIPTRGLVERVRRAKDAYEVECIERACRLTQEALVEVLLGIRPGRTEWQVAVELERAMVDLGADAAAFDSIVAAGGNSAIPHHRPGDTVVQSGDLLKIDCGARYAGYHADMTRTFVVGADPTSRQEQLHAAVAAAAAAGRDAVAPGVSARAADSAARAQLGDDAALFNHGLGHGVGLQIHEAPLVAARSADTMEAADVLTIEPGLYQPGFGGVRIEDTLLVTDTGARCLTTMPRGLVRLA